jgi:hypothetical protein
VAISIAISGLTVLALWEQADHATLLTWLAAATLEHNHRHRNLSDGCGRCGRPAQNGRQRDVPRQAGGAQFVSLLRR